MIGHYRITLLGRTADKKNVRLVRYHSPEGKDVLEATKVLLDVLGKISEAKRLSVTRVTMERVDGAGHIV